MCINIIDYTLDFRRDAHCIYLSYTSKAIVSYGSVDDFSYLAKFCLFQIDQ